MSRVVWAFVMGFMLGVLLLRTPVVDAAMSHLMFGSFNGLASVIQVTTDGAVIVTTP